MKLPVYDSRGMEIIEEIEAEESIYGLEPNDHVLYMAVRAELANLRQGTHSTKTKGEVRGGGRKPWRQKGRGVARAGSIRSPIWVGGGVTFGPKPRKYTIRLNKKVKKLARKCALSLHARNKTLLLIQDINLEQPKTKEMAAILKAMNLEGKKVTYLFSDFRPNVYLSGRNIPGLFIHPAESASTYKILNCDVLLMDRSAYDKLNELLTK